MKRNKITQDLQKFGLDDIEAAIYLHLLEKGPKSPLALSREMDINRSRVYRHAKKLFDKSLIEDSTTIKGRKLKAVKPEYFRLQIEKNESLLEEQKQAFPTLLEDLSKFPDYSKNQFEIKHYHGKKGMRQMFWNRLAAKSKMLVFSYESDNKIVGRGFAEKARHEQVKRRIKKFEVENHEDKGRYYYTDVPRWPEFYESYTLPVDVLKIGQITSLYNDTVAIMNPSNKDMVGVEIINSLYCDMQKQIFWKFWEIGEGLYRSSQ